MAQGTNKTIKGKPTKSSGPAGEQTSTVSQNYPTQVLDGKSVVADKPEEQWGAMLGNGMAKNG